MLVLFETSGGFALFKVKDSKKLKKVENIAKEFSSLERSAKIVKLKAFSKFQDARVALEAATSISLGQVGKSLRKFLKKNILSKEISDSLLVIDKKLKSAIEDTLGIKCLYSSKYLELVRGIRTQIEGLLSGFTAEEQKSMSLGLAHSLCRHTLKFSVDKIDTMVVQAVKLLDDIDKELNNYAMRLKEWYSWHFPELVRIVTDNITFAKCVQLIGQKENAATLDLSSVLPTELEEEVKEAAELSMGTEVTESDIAHINTLCAQIVTLAEYRQSLSEYLANRMQAIAPNLTVLVGELVGARLIAHTGSLVNLAKHPASTIQILGAEKALFRAIKTKHDTPKYGLIYHASIIGSAAPKLKGKISRSLAAKCALSVRVDALGQQDGATIGLQHKEQLESRIRYLESVGGGGLTARHIRKYEKPAEGFSYTEVDVTDVEVPRKREGGKLKSEGKKRKKSDS